jgi:hypothetical protein
MVVFEQLKITGLLCSRFSATVQKGRRFFTLAGKDMELPNGKGGRKKPASKRQQAACPAAPALDGGSPVEGEMAEELLAVPGPSDMGVGASGSVPPVPAEDSAAAAALAAAGPPPANPAVEPAMVQPSAPAMEHVVAVEPTGVELSVPAVEAAAAAPVAEAATAVRLVSEALSGLALELAAAKKPTAGVLAGEPAAVEPKAATAAVSTAVPTPAKEGRPVLADGPAASPKECWVLNPGIGPKVMVRKIHSGSAAAAAEVAASGERRAGEPVPGPGLPPAARRAAAEIKFPPVATTSKPAAAAAPGKRKAKAGVTGGSQKRKKSSPVKIKDL